MSYFHQWLWELSHLGILDVIPEGQRKPPWWYLHEKQCRPGNKWPPLSCSKGCSHTIIWKNWPGTPYNWPQERKTDIRNFIIVGWAKGENSVLVRITIPPYQKFEASAYPCACIKPWVCWQNDSVHELYCWEMWIRLQKVPQLLPWHAASGHLQLPNEVFEVWQIGFMQLLHLVDINIC